jgi:hypothetical protein
MTLGDGGLGGGDALALREHFSSIRLCRGIAPPSCRTCSVHGSRDNSLSRSRERREGCAWARLGNAQITLEMRRFP